MKTRTFPTTLVFLSLSFMIGPYSKAENVIVDQTSGTNAWEGQAIVFPRLASKEMDKIADLVVIDWKSVDEYTLRAPTASEITWYTNQVVIDEHNASMARVKAITSGRMKWRENIQDKVRTFARAEVPAVLKAVESLEASIQNRIDQIRKIEDLIAHTYQGKEVPRNVQARYAEYRDSLPEYIGKYEYYIVKLKELTLAQGTLELCAANKESDEMLKQSYEQAKQALLLHEIQSGQ